MLMQIQDPSQVFDVFKIHVVLQSLNPGIASKVCVFDHEIKMAKKTGEILYSDLGQVSN
jgi:hypothetical protein